MFVHHRQDLLADAEFPADLEKLGYFINDKDQIRKISDPTQEFQFKINRNDRWNDVQREAMNECIRTIVQTRLRTLGLVTLRLPLTPIPNKPHVPILVSQNLAKASRIILVFGEPVQDLGIWAYRTVGAENINAGSAIDFAKAVLYPNDAHAYTGTHGAEYATSTSNGHIQSPKGDTALVLANTGQLYWHCGMSKAMTYNTKLALPRASAVDPPLAETSRNKIPGHENWENHVSSVFEEILNARGRLVKNDAKIQVIGASEGGKAVVTYLGANWQKWHTHISAICLANPLHRAAYDLPTPTSTPGPSTTPSFTEFFSSRCRAYLLSPEPLGFPLSLPEREEYGCNCYSSGEELNAECILPRAWGIMLGWLGRAFDDEFGEGGLVIQEVKGEDIKVDGGDLIVEEVVDENEN
ncbi:Arb2 domain-containing protein [Aspergillus venezuelensis]